MHDRKRVFVIDDHPMTRQGLVTVLTQSGWDVLGEAGTLSEAQERLTQVRPDLVLTDLRLHQEDGLVFLKQLKAWFPRMPVVVVSMLDEQTYAKRCLDLGAQAFVSKSAPREDLLEAVAQASAGHVWVSQAMRDFLLGMPKKPSSLAGSVQRLSNRELQVFRLVGEGMTTKEIAHALGVTPRTVESHKEHIKEKMMLESAAALSTKAALWLQGQL